MTYQELRALDRWISENVPGLPQPAADWVVLNKISEGIRMVFTDKDQADHWLATQKREYPVEFANCEVHKLTLWRPYSSRRECAFELLEKCCEKHCVMTWRDVHTQKWHANLTMGGPALGQADNLPLAICLFAKELFSQKGLK
ncbi:MAG TPA: hypothetical protein VD994_17045 [Prosthecobacter sp.]|nr:hypothetical protein [Prosthecobacter sp.]